jgi:predicted NBD/HSP70 family sugar kinase
VNSRTPLGASRIAVLEAIHAAEAVSRVEVALRTGLTQATVSNAVRDLIDAGLVIVSGERTPTRGKPRTLLQVNPLARCAIGVQLGADAIVVCITDAVGAVVARTRLRGARDDDPGEVIDRIAATIEALISTTALARDAIVGIGVVSPGLVDIDEGVILRSRSLRRWVGFGLRDAVTSATGFPVVIDNDATAAALGEFWRRSIPETLAHCTVHMGATVGVGILVGSAPYRGASGNTGAIGPMRIRRGSSWQGTTVDDVTTPRAVAERAHRAIARGVSTSITLSPERDWYLDFQSIAIAAVHGDQLALDLILESADHLADALVVVANLLDVDSISLAGPAFATAGTLYLKHLSQRIADEAFAAERHPIRLRLTEQPSDAAAIGAAALILQQQFARREASEPISG